MATLEKIRVEITPMSDAGFKAKPYVLTFEHTAPNFVAAKLLGDIKKLLTSEYVAEGVKNIRVQSS